MLEYSYKTLAQHLLLDLFYILITKQNILLDLKTSKADVEEVRVCLLSYLALHIVCKV